MVQSVSHGDMATVLCAAHLLGFTAATWEAKPFNNMKEIKEQVTEKMGSKLGEKIIKENPFLTSCAFIQLMKAVAALPKMILLMSKGPGEAMNGIQSVVVTFLKNVPDVIWDSLRETVIDQPNHPGAVVFNQMDAIRSYPGDDKHKYIEIHEDDDDVVFPVVNAPMPNKPC